MGVELQCLDFTSKDPAEILSKGSLRKGHTDAN